MDAATGVITTIAGNGQWGFNGDGIPATSASLDYPEALAVDATDSLLISDGWQNRVRRIDAATGIITTVAGNGTYAFSGDGGRATNASFGGTLELALDANGNLYIGDWRNQRVRRVAAGADGLVIGAADEIITTVAGNGDYNSYGDGGPAIRAALRNPFGVAVDHQGNLFIAEEGGHRIRRVILATGIISTVAGDGNFGFGGDGGPPRSANLTRPVSLAVDADGNLYISDSTNVRIRRVSPPFNLPPTANAGPDQTVIVSESVQFDGRGSSDPEGALVSFEWNFGDGATASGAVVTHAYAAPGTFLVRLTVKDAPGDMAVDTAIAYVLSVPQAIQSLSALVQSFNFQQGISNSLDVKLQNAIEALESANAQQRQDAVNKLQAFIDAVEAQRGKEITSAQADALIALAKRILAVL